VSPRKAPEPQTCGEPAEDGQNCNLPKGHEGDHTYIAPKAEEPAAEPETIAAAAERVFGEETVRRPVIRKLAQIMGDLPVLVPAGKNSHFGYEFIKDTQISGVIRPRMAKAGLMVIPDVLEESWVETKTSRGGSSFVTKMKIRFTVIDCDTGDEISGTGMGYGDDSGDKGANKAFTAAMKYWLMKLFQIGGEDIEDDARADQRAAEREAGTHQLVADVKVDSAKIEGVQRGGRSDKMTATQKRQIFALYQKLELTPEGFAERIEQHLGDKLVFEENSDPTGVLNAYLNHVDADDAGKLLSALVEENDDRNAQAQAAAGEGYGG